MNSASQPNAEQGEGFECQGQIKVGSGVSISLTSMHLDWGRWDPPPPASLAGPGAANWRARQRGDAGVEGSIIYETRDNARFTLYFDVPLWSGINRVVISCTGEGCSGYNFSVTPVPEKDVSISPVYEIEKK